MGRTRRDAKEEKPDPGVSEAWQQALSGAPSWDNAMPKVYRCFFASSREALGSQRRRSGQVQGKG